MKKLLTICLLIATAFTTNAQNGKPTKEQTLSFLTKTFKLSEGETRTRITTRTDSKFIKTLCDFSIDKIIENYDFESVLDGTEKSQGNKGYTYSNLKWESVTSIKLSSQEGNLTMVKIEFSSKIFVRDTDTYKDYINEITLDIVTSKAESFKKALERLVEIAKEENKNPFED